MKIAPLHPRETERVAALREYNILDTMPESSYDDLVFLASQICDVPIALVSLIDDQRQWFKSKIGLDAEETSRELSFCAHAILEDGVFKIPDATRDERFADNPLVTGPPEIRFYAGMPLTTSDGLPLGTLCVIDSTPHTMTSEQARALETLGRQVMAQLELRRHAAELQQKTTELEEQQQLFNAFMDHSPAVAFLKDDSGRMLYANRRFEEVFGRPVEEIVGKTDQELWPKEIAEALQNNDRKILECDETVQIVETTTYSIQGDVSTQENSTLTREWLSVKFPLHDVGERKMLGGIALDITEQEKQATQLRETLRLQKAILDHAPYAVVSTDAQGLITLFNRAAERMKSFSQEQVLGKNCALLINDFEQVKQRAETLSRELGREIEPGFEVLVARAREREVDEQEWELVHSNGTRFPALMAVTALRDDNENITGFLGIIQDISERKRMERMKNEFVSTVSHELRTPLTSIRGSLGLLVGGVAGELPERAKSMVTIAHNNAERLVRLINDILDIEKIESGKLSLDLQTYDMGALTRSALEANRAYGESLNVRFELQDALQTPFLVRADADRLQQVLANLLSNAAKYSPMGDVVCVRLEQEKNGGKSAVRVSIEDGGNGVPPEFRERIFSKFAQADSSDTRQKGGTGLGLAISKSLVEQMGGEISFDSEPGRTVFFFTLPEALAEKTETSDEYSTKPRILICEDDRDVAHLLEIMLARSGVQAHVVHSLQAARKALQNQNFNALTLDLTLPDGDGLTLLRELRAQTQTRDLPVIIVSARTTHEGKAHERSAYESSTHEYSTQERDAQSQSLGRETLDNLQGAALCITDWLEKPIEQGRLAQAVQDALRRVESENAHARPRVLHVEDDSDVREVVASLLQEEADVAWAKSVMEARSLLQNEKFDLILLDLELSGETGTELLRDLPGRALQTPVVIFSASETRADAAQQIKAALVKSRTSNEELLQTVRSWLPGRNAQSGNAQGGNAKMEHL